MKNDIDFMRKTYTTCLAAGIPIVSADTAARIMAVTYVHGNNEFMSHSEKFAVEAGYIRERFGIQGGCVPETEIAALIRQYVEELELYAERNPKDRYPEWALGLFKTRYGFTLIN